MPGESVRNRIAALQGNAGEPPGSSTTRRAHKLSLKTDEHIKEEFLRRGDGGWSKNVDIGQQQPFVPPSPMPFIKVTAETPVVTKPKAEFPGKLPKNVPGAFEPAFESREADVAPVKANKTRQPGKINEHIEAETTDVPVQRYEELLNDEAGNNPPPRAHSHIRQHDHQPRVDDDNDLEALHEEPSRREKIIFNPTLLKLKHKTRDRSRSTSADPVRSHRRSQHRSHSARQHIEDAEYESSKRSRSRSAALPSARVGHDRVAQEEHHGPRHKHSSRSRSRHEQEPRLDRSSAESAKRSGHALWPSFAQSGRRSMSDILETTSTRGRSSHSRRRSDASTAATRNELSPKKLEFAEYVAGKKIDHVPSSPPLRPPPSPMGYIRSRSSTGEYSEGFTREKELLRKPSEDEVVEHAHHHRGRKERQHSWHDVIDKREAEPWQVKLLQGIARM